MCDHPSWGAWSHITNPHGGSPARLVPSPSPRAAPGATFSLDIFGDLYHKAEVRRRQNTRYSEACAGLFDLHLVMPLCLPYGSVVVDSPSGQNFYEFDDNYPGAQLLFGRAAGTGPHGKPVVPANQPSDVADGVGAEAETPTEVGRTSTPPVEGESAANSDAVEVQAKEDEAQRETKADRFVAGDESQGSGETGDTTKDAAEAASANDKTEVASSNDGKTPKVEEKDVSHDHQKTTSQKTSRPSCGVTCDTWASFLEVRLGTLYNIRMEQMPLVCEVFNRAFEREACSFLVPITLDCRGIYPAPDDSVAQKHSQTLDGTTHERYETHARLTTENDKARFRMIRRHLKKFARDLMLEVNGPLSPQTVGGEVPPRLRVELHDNCRSARLDGGIRIMIREWAPVQDPAILRAIWTGWADTSVPTANSPSSPAACRRRQMPGRGLMEQGARAYLGEVRLEYTHMRMVDPRWPHELVLGRRLADFSPEHDVPIPMQPRARFVFCNRIAAPRVRYAFPGGTDALLKGRLSFLYKSHLAEWHQLLTERRHQRELNRQHQNTAAPRYVRQGPNTWQHPLMPPQTTTGPAGTKLALPFLRQPERQTDWDNTPSTAAGTPVADGIGMKGPITSEPCRYFLTTGCARGDTCFFLHPADMKTESGIDIRNVRHKDEAAFLATAV